MRSRLSPGTRFATAMVATFALLVAACSHAPRAASVPLPERAPAIARDDTAPPTASMAAQPQRRIALATGGERETDYRIGREIAEFIGPDAGLAIDARATRGSAENMYLLRDDPDVALAIVQYDVVQALLDESAKGNAVAARLVKPLRVVMPLYTQEIYFVVRSDSPMKSIHEIKGRTINVGVRGSGSALTVAALYARMFKSPIPASNVRYLADDRALTELTLERSLDVVAVVAGQPAKIFADMKSEARRYIKLLRVDDAQPATQAAYRAYFPARIRAANYASWLDADVPTLSVMSFLVTVDDPDKPTPWLALFARSVCRNLGSLKADGHPKWREVDPTLRLGFRWTYANASEAEFKQCAERRPMSAAKP